MLDTLDQADKNNPVEQVITVTLKMKVYKDELGKASMNVWLYQLINRLNYEHDILEVTIDGKHKVLNGDEDVKNLPLREGKELT